MRQLVATPRESVTMSRGRALATLGALSITLQGSAPVEKTHRLSVVGFVSGRAIVRFSREFSGPGKIRVEESGLSGYVDFGRAFPSDCQIDLTLVDPGNGNNELVHMRSLEELEVGSSVSYPSRNESTRIVVSIQ